MKTSLFAKQFIPILAQTTSGDLAGGASKALGIVMLIGFIFGTICVIGGGFAIRRGDTDAGKRSIIGGLIIAGAPVIVKALFTAFGIELPMTILANKDAGPAALLIYRSILVFSFGGGAIGNDGGIPVDTDFDVICDQRLEIHAAGLAVLQVLRPVLDVPVGAVMDVVLVQDPLQESDVRFDDSRIEILDELLQLALVTRCVATSSAAGREQENQDCEKMLHRLTLLRCSLSGRELAVGRREFSTVG
jgi:hypothetical protein